MSTPGHGHDRVALPGSERPTYGSPIDRPLPDEPVSVTLVLREHADLEAYVENPDTGPLTYDELSTRFGATEEEVAAVRRFADENTLQVDSVDRAMRTVTLRGTPAQLAAAFGVELSAAQSDDSVYRVRTGPVHVPAYLVDVVAAVLGLDNRPQAHAHLIRAAAAQTSFTPLDLAKLYDFPTDVTGGGQTIGIIELDGGYNDAEVAQYFADLGVSPAPTVVSVGVDGATNAPNGDPNSADGEVLLDIEVAGAVAPGAKIAVYFAPNTDQGFLDAVTTAAHDGVSVISISWGASESNWTAQAMNAMSSAFKAASALGISVFAAAGDDGSNDRVGDTKAHVDFPASSPYAVGCGGTALVASNGQITSETVWNDPGHGSTGGGVSDHFPVPSYQKAINPTSANSATHHGRGVPDVSGDADPATGYQVLVDGQQLVFGGTSAVAPLWAGLTALLQQALNAKLAPLHPKIYGSEQGFRDITEGSNGAYSANSGWDACTGLGSPDGNALLARLRGESPSGS